MFRVTTASLLPILLVIFVEAVCVATSTLNASASSASSAVQNEAASTSMRPPTLPVRAHIICNKAYVPCSTYRDCASINGHTRNKCFQPLQLRARHQNMHIAVRL